MEAVRAFNNELSSLYEVKPPISRAKMATVTKTAIKAIKYYKHVVQSIEKFIQKCKPEYKVPGLYVIDSVVRQSRHQFGSNKDVFAPRFTKNIITTFQNLFKCPGDERSKIVRVLNLWQKNEVFPSEIIQPLLDLAADPTKPSTIAAAQTSVDGWLAANGKPSSSQPQQMQQASQPSNHEEQMSQSAAESMLATQNDMLNTVTQLLQQTNSSNTSLSAQQQQLQHLQLLQQQLVQQTQLMQQPTGSGPIIDPNLLAQIQALTNQLLIKTEPKQQEEGFNKKLLDFDYGESEDEEEEKKTHQVDDGNVTGNVQTILNDPSLMQQIHQVSQSIQKNEEMKSEIDEERRRVLEQQQAEFDQQIALGMPPPQHHPQMSFEQPPPMPEAAGYREEGEYVEEPNDEDFRDHHQLKDRDEREGRRDRRRRSRSRSRTPKRKKRTRSRSRDRRRRSRSRSRHKRSRSRDREREKQKEKERERRRRNLPPIKDQHVAICTTTIWIGHLNKFTSEDELKTEIEHYGPVQTINMVPPRGCAYIVMKERKDAAKAIDRLKGYKLNGSALKTAWAQSSGIRESEFKDGWDVDNGTMYIPWDRLPSDLSHLLEGAIIDADSLPDKMKDIPTQKLEADQATAEGTEVTSSQMATAPDQPSQSQMESQPPVMGMMQPGMPPQMSGMMPGMMMPMQRPLVPGMPGQPMSMGPAPPQMMAGAARAAVPPLPGVGQPGTAVAAMSIANTTASSITQTIQNMLPTTAGLVPGSPAGGPRPMGFPPRFGFNPNMPPPGFRMPPPGFPPHMRPLRMPAMAPPSEEKAEDAPNKEPPPREMIWPPDSNEKDEDDMDEEDQDADKEKDFNKPEGDEPPQGFVPPNDQPPFGMMGPVPPGGFPPGPPHAWPMGLGIRPPGPRPMRFPAGMPDMFNGPRGPMMGGPMGPPFMGMGPGFPRFPPGMGPGPRPGPVSLLDLDIKPPPRFSEENKEKDDMETAEGQESGQENEDEEEPNEEGQVQEEEDEEPSSSYPFGAWQSVPSPSKQSNYNNKESEEGNEDREDRDRHRSWDEEGSRSRRDYDRRDRDRDRGDRSHRDRGDRDRGGWDRGDRDRDRNRDRDRDWGRDRDRDWRRRDDRRDRDRDRGRDRDGHRRQRKSRWGDPIENTDDSQPPVLEREGFPEITREDNFDNTKEPDLSQEYGGGDMSGDVNNSEFNPYDGDSNRQLIENDNNNAGFMNQTDGDHEGNMNGENTSENQHDTEPPNLEQEMTNLETDTSTNGPDSVKHMPAVISNKLDVIPDLGIGNTDGSQDNIEKTEPNDREYEEGELDS